MNYETLTRQAILRVRIFEAKNPEVFASPRSKPLKIARLDEFRNSKLLISNA